MALTPRPANFTAPDFWVDHNDQDLFQAIKEGGASVGRSPLMAPWGASFNDDQIRQLVEVVKGFRPATAP
jgi:hypothetical protein